MRALLIPVVLLSACAPDRDDVTPDDRPASQDNVDVRFEDEGLPGAEQIVITTREGDVDLGLTDAVLYVRLNPKKVDEIQAEIDQELEGTDGLGRSIAEAVTGVVSDAMQHAVTFPIEDVEAVRYEDGRLEVDLVGEDDAIDLGRDGEPIGEAFAPDDAERFVEAFEAIKAGH